MRSEPTESRLGERLEVAEAQIGAGQYQLVVVISQVAAETVAEVAFTVLFGVNVPRSRETIMKVVSDRSFLVMAENDAGDIQGHHLAYAHGLQETPFRFTSTAQLTDTTKLGASGRPDRVRARHQCSCSAIGFTPTPTPRPSEAILKARAALLGRAQTCQRIRNHLRNLIAVDFYRRADVFGVVDALNGESR